MNTLLPFGMIVGAEIATLNVANTGEWSLVTISVEQPEKSHTKK